MPFKLSVAVTVAALIIGSAFQNAHAAPANSIDAPAVGVADQASQPDGLICKAVQPA